MCEGRMNGREFIRVITKDNEECFLLTELRDKGKEGFELSVFHNGEVWTGDVSEDDLDDLSSRLKMNFDKYVTQTVEALTSTQDNKDIFQYQLKRHRDKADFVWKKHVPAEDITFQLGSVSLHARRDSGQFITMVFEYCIQSMAEVKERIRSLETDNERLSQERINALKRLERCVVAKEELEQELYSKFSLVLNSKKNKIRQLKQQVTEGVPVHNSGDASEDEPVASTSGLKRSKSPEYTGEQSKSDSEVNTDDEQPKAKRKKQAPSKKVQLKADESLDLGKDEKEVLSHMSRPTRQRGRQQKKQTPSKPILPRIGSNESTGSDKKPRLRKNGSSNSSNKSSENIDADDLLGDL